MRLSPLLIFVVLINVCGVRSHDIGPVHRAEVENFSTFCGGRSSHSDLSGVVVSGSWVADLRSLQWPNVTTEKKNCRHLLKVCA